MNRTSLLTIAFASLALGGCATYDYMGDTAPGGYYHGRPSTQYSDPYGGYYGGGVYGNYGYGSPYRYGGYSGYPYYGYYGSHYPYYPPRPPHPPRPGDNNPPPSSGSGNRPPPWRDSTGRWREGGAQPLIPGRPGHMAPAPSQPRVGEGGYRPPRVMSSPSMPRSAERPRIMERAAPPPRAERPFSSPRMERPAPPSRPAPRDGGGVRQHER
ncbi:hypothetical protein J2X02_003664 [Pseudoxanthomonas japonensis]|jgi:hypothetical protein|uniref:hypothetical protein n=1 Tax=Pseudoxanthomonas japonensis TaxID=69284 RepID=UPI0028610C12|nr:hypothetical protein [Pseudoxanthomonas japonensis]MDR7070793.1 hypothetical protein [Pseudoxanthomonas japonensis]